MTVLPTPDPGPAAAAAWVARRLGDLALEGPDGIEPSPRFRGGQTAADDALAAYDVTGYARQRNQVLPRGDRGASALSPFIRHGLLPLRRVWDHAGGGPPADARKLRDELLWQEYARHLYARVGAGMGTALRYAPARAADGWPDPWPRDMACVDVTVGELERDGWLVNQTRMWLASQWTVRAGAEWRAGEDRFFAHLLDGSRAANRLGWQWTVGAGTGKPYGFSRSQVRKRAPGLCATCAREHDCPIADWPDAPRGPSADPDPRLRHDPDLARTTGPTQPRPAAPRAVDSTGSRIGDDPDVVWLTAESLGDADPALAAHPDLEVVFVVDEPLLRRLRLSGKRLCFIAETLADLATRRRVVVHRGRPAAVLADRRPAVTHAPVPGFARISARLDLAVVHPWPWLAAPHDGPVQSFSAWRKRVREPRD